jgi:DNA-binding CsgD family transcriptional regulator/PAS domain-containing protein
MLLLQSYAVLSHRQPKDSAMLGDLFDPQLVELIYRSALEPEHWPRALAGIVGRFHGDHAFLFTNKESRVTNPFAATTGLDDDDLARYFSPEGIRLWAPWQEKCRPGNATSQDELISDRDFDRSQVYNDIIRPTGGFHAAFVQQDTANLSFHVAICRPRGTGHLAANEKSLFQALVPHFTCALELQFRLKLAEQRTQSLAAALDRLPEGAVVTNADGKPLIVNARAEQLLKEGDGLAFDVLGLRSSNGVLTEQLLDAIAKIGNSRDAHGQRLHLPRKPPRLPLLVEILPVWRLAPPTAGTSEAAVVIFIREPDAPLTIDAKALSDIYRLTPREAEIAALLAYGSNIATIAAKLGLADGTVRFNLKRAFEKTGARSQAALVALLRGFATPRN